MLELEGSPIPGKTRVRLNLGLALDRSGSMAGEKLEHVKTATRNLLDRLAADDRVSLTIFDDNVDTLIPSSLVGQTGDVRGLISSIRDGGSTFLSGGYERAFNQVFPHVSGDVVSRIVLLTDGLANVGVRDPEQLQSIAREYLKQGVSTTTIGVGEDYDEGLLGKIAECGAGGTYLIENPDDAGSVFEEELGYLQTLTATSTKVRFSPGPGVAVIRQLNNYRRDDGGSYEIGDLFSGQVKRLLLELAVTPDQHSADMNIGKFDVEYSDLSTGTVTKASLSSDLTMPVVSSREASGMSRDRDVLLQCAFLLASAAKTSAIKLANDSKFDDAAALLERCAEELAGFRIDEQRLTEEIRELRARAASLREQREEFFTVRERKRWYYEAEKTGKSADASVASMKFRRKD
jgi:Ca-activated chloride channel family protein